jgi:hypothetical protein
MPSSPKVSNRPLTSLQLEFQSSQPASSAPASPTGISITPEDLIPRPRTAPPCKIEEPQPVSPVAGGGVSEAPAASGSWDRLDALRRTILGAHPDLFRGLEPGLEDHVDVSLVARALYRKLAHLQARHDNPSVKRWTAYIQAEIADMQRKLQSKTPTEQELKEKQERTDGRKELFRQLVEENIRLSKEHGPILQQWNACLAKYSAAEKMLADERLSQAELRQQIALASQENVELEHQVWHLHRQRDGALRQVQAQDTRARLATVLLREAQKLEREMNEVEDEATRLLLDQQNFQWANEKSAAYNCTHLVEAQEAILTMFQTLRAGRQHTLTGQALHGRAEQMVRGAMGQVNEEKIQRAVQ